MPKPNMIINLGEYFQVIDERLAREIMWNLGMGCTRIDNGSMNVYSTNNGGSLYMKPEGNEDHYLGYLRVDEGYFSVCLQRRDGKLVSEHALAYAELVDTEEFLGLVTKHLLPGFEAPECHAMGRGFRQQHFMHAWTKALCSIPRGTHDVEFVNNVP
jgi:hypothetical protein